MAEKASWWGTYTGRRINRRRFVAGAAATAGAAAILACGGDGGGGGLQFDDAGNARQPGKVWNAVNDWKLGDETKQAVKGGVYRSFMSEDQAGSFDALINAPSQVPYSAHVHEYLMGKNRGIGVDPRSPEASVPVPVLATSTEMANDGLSVTFKMRPNVKFHNVAPVNGRVMDIDDWKTTLERFLALSAQREPLLELLDKAEYPDAQTMVMKLKFSYAPFMDRIHSERFAFQVLPKELNANQELAASKAIGTSYKVLDRHQPSVAMEYKKHSEYWAGEPYIDRWNFPIITEYANRYAQFVAGNMIDFAPNSRDVLKLAQDVPQAVIVAQPINEEQFARIIFGREQADTKPWRDPRVRIAIRRAADMRGIGEFQANKTQFEAAGIPVEVRSRSHLMSDPRYWLDPEKNELGPVSQNYLFSIEEARKLLTAAGATIPVEIDFRVLPAGGETPEEERLTIDSLNRSGLFKVTQTNSVNTVEHRNCRSLRQCVGIVTSSTNEDADYALREYFSKGPRPGGEPAFPSPNLDRLAEAYRREPDLQRRIALLKEVQQTAGEFFPTVPRPHQFTAFTFRWPWLRNTNHGWNGVSLDGRPIWGGYKQWLDPDMPRRG